MDDKVQSGKLVGSFIAGLIIGVGVMFLIGSSDLKPNTDVVGKELGGISNDGMTLKSENGSISVSDQLSGDRVLLDEVSFESVGWVVIHEENNGVLGNALGARRFDAGLNKKGYVKLLRNTEIDQTYHALLYNDNGDKEFNLENDMPLRDSAGGFIEAVFNVVRVDRKSE